MHEWKKEKEKHFSSVDWNDKNYIKGFPFGKILRNG